MVEHSAVNRVVVGSSPTRGAGSKESKFICSPREIPRREKPALCAASLIFLEKFAKASNFSEQKN